MRFVGFFLLDSNEERAGLCSGEKEGGREEEGEEGRRSRRGGECAFRVSFRKRCASFALKPEPCGNGSGAQVNSAPRGSREVRRATADSLRASERFLELCFKKKKEKKEMKKKLSGSHR